MADSERARAGGGTETAIAPGLMARITGAVRGAVTGFTQGWFPPGEPMKPMAPEAIGRRFDYPAYVNTTNSPRQEQPSQVSFDTLRRLAEPSQGGLDLLRLAIETRKDQMVAQRWKVRGRKTDDDGGTAARAFELAMRKPDGVLTFRQWMKLLLEDHFVIDAPSIYYRKTAAGVLCEVVDGATLKVLIDEKGRTPLPPLPAYQQFLHGVPADDYKLSELGQYMYNPRPNRIYGMSRVEQVIGIVTLALNRQLSVLSYYTEGNIPEQMIGVPEAWNVDQIKDMQTWWDSILAGQVGMKRRAWFIPGGMEPKPTKDAILQDEFDEWLARIVCYAFSLSPQTLVKEVNRATAETAKQSSAEDGLEPVKLWFKDVMDDVLLRAGLPELEFAYDDEEIQDPTVKAAVINQYTAGRPIVGLDEARKIAGLPPASAETKAQIEHEWEKPEPLDLGGGGFGPDGQPLTGKDPQTGKEKPKSDDAGDDGKKPNDSAAKRRGRSLPPTVNERLRTTTERGIAKLVAAVLAEQLAAVLAALDARTAKLEKLASEDDLTAMLQELDAHPWNERARDRLRELLKRMGKERATAALRTVRPPRDDNEAHYRELLSQANGRAIAFAEDRVGNLITQVSASTRDAVNELTAAALRDGTTNAQLAERLTNAWEFSAGRAERIARTETALAETEGTLAGYAASGVVEAKEWSADELACDECEALDGEVVPLDAEFSDGSNGPPAHPDCRCTIVPVVAAAAELAESNAA